MPGTNLPHHPHKGAPASAAGNCVLIQSRYEEPEGAWEIIKKGPERLESQFAAGYSMVLNLLYTRSLQEAAESLNLLVGQIQANPQALISKAPAKEVQVKP